MKVTTAILLLIGTTSFCMAGLPVAAPEIDANSAMSGVLLVSAALVMFRGRRKS